MNRDIMLESKQMVWDIKEHLKKWVEKNKTETNYIAMTPIENFIRQKKRVPKHPFLILFIIFLF